MAPACRPDRIVAIAERFGMDPWAVLDNVIFLFSVCECTRFIYARAYTYEHQHNLLLGLAAKMAEEPFRLLIVDSVIALFQEEMRQKLAQMLSRLIKIAEEFNVAVYMTNQVIADPGGGIFITDRRNQQGGMYFWDYVERKQLEWSVSSEWSPNGCYFMTATTTPRLQVDNGIKMFHYNGSLYFKQMFDKLYQSYSFSFVVILIHSLVMAIVLNFTMFLCTIVNSALTTMIVGVLKGVGSKSLVVLLICTGVFAVVRMVYASRKLELDQTA
ncbi:eukaryotic translation initiation factor eIF2A [Medicago truncatula]|uniref:Eukaryotic translation initiation factor eIF2A n=1 Tax=Medicago truncatula TaxID=3880 RepID=G7KD71_MEDTR|nr:eukaryotic translation initiation factor eIF2A [Medicago truncatula]